MRVALALLLTLLAVSAFGQEFSASGGNIEMITKRSAPFSGSLGLSSNKGFDLGLGGTLVKDRVWFFATAERSESMFASRPALQMSDAKLTTQLGDRQNLAASGHLSTGVIPTSFLSLHYTGIVSDNMFVSASFSQLRRN